MKSSSSESLVNNKNPLGQVHKEAAHPPKNPLAGLMGSSRVGTLTGLTLKTRKEDAKVLRNGRGVLPLR